MIIAERRLLAGARPLFSGNRDEALRVLLAPCTLLLVWLMTRLDLPMLAWWGAVTYSLLHLALLVLNWKRGGPTPVRDTLALLADAGLAVLVLLMAPSLGIAVYPLYVLVSLRVLSVYRRLSTATIVPFLLGPMVLFVQMSAGQPSNDLIVLGGQGILLLGSLLFGLVAIMTNAAKRTENARLRQALADAHRAAELRVTQLQNTSNDLRARMREQHALEEGLRVITSTLSLDEVLPQIVESAMQMFGPNGVHALALTLPSDDGFDHHMMVLNGNTDSRWADVLARRVLMQRTPLILSDVELDGELAAVTPLEMRAALSVPLILSDGSVRGALTVGSARLAAFSSTDARHLSGFAMQAGIAISNAALHSQIRRQQVLLEAVVHDISDGLVVINQHGEVLLNNPLGRTLLESVATDDNGVVRGTVRAQIDDLAANVPQTGTAVSVSEIRTGSEEAGTRRFFQALASRVHHGASDDLLTAVVLHDITAQKDEERERGEFISMVSHELRNPLNTLNGFVKIVLQGRAGKLNEMQEEFLSIADAEIEKLKGRISELLEFNRMEGKRLVLNPQWNNIAQLVSDTTARLQLQANQAGITLFNDTTEDVPDCLFDNERIGQVLTNLVENAIKATPDGGSIRVRSELHDNELWVRVADTGVGIAPEHQSKIFQAFYRAHDRASSRGNHLGLGLAICQQIIEGHQGRIWVESEVGKGTCFSFALPFTDETERALELGA